MFISLVSCYNYPKITFIPAVQADFIKSTDKHCKSGDPVKRLCSVCQVLYKHEDQAALKFLDKTKTSVSLPLPKDNGYIVLEIWSWGEGGDGPAHEIIVSRDSGDKSGNTNQIFLWFNSSLVKK